MAGYPDISIHSAAWGLAVWSWVVFSAVLMPMELRVPRWAGRNLKNLLTWKGLLSMGLFFSVFVLMLLREVALGVLVLGQWLGVDVPIANLPASLHRYRASALRRSATFLWVPPSNRAICSASSTV